MLPGVPDIYMDTATTPQTLLGYQAYRWIHSQQPLQLCWGYLAYRWIHSQQQSLQLCWRYLTHTWIQSATFKAYNAVRVPVRQVPTQSGATPPTLPVVPATQMNIQSTTKPTTLPWVPAIQVDKLQLGIMRVCQQHSFQVCYGHPPPPTQSATMPTSFPGRYPPDRWICCRWVLFSAHQHQSLQLRWEWGTCHIRKWVQGQMPRQLRNKKERDHPDIPGILCI